jgi:hypothetical protein
MWLNTFDTKLQLEDENNQLKYYLDEKEKESQYWRS